MTRQERSAKIWAVLAEFQSDIAAAIEAGESYSITEYALRINEIIEEET